jgi:hypothetical protein
MAGRLRGMMVVQRSRGSGGRRALLGEVQQQLSGELMVRMIRVA